MRTRITLFLIVTALLTFKFNALSAQTPTVNVKNLYPGKVLQKFTHRDYSWMIFSYNDMCQLVKIDYVNEDLTSEYIFTYDGGEYNGEHYDVCMKIVSNDGSENWTEISYIKVGKNGFAESCIEAYDDYDDGLQHDYYNFEYNSDNQLSKIVITNRFGTEIQEISYVNGDIANVHCSSNYGEEVWYCYYSDSSAPNTYNLTGPYWCYDANEQQQLAYAGLLGLPSKHLPSHIGTPEESVYEQYGWVLDGEGYPIEKADMFDGTATTDECYYWAGLDNKDLSVKQETGETITMFTQDGVINVLNAPKGSAIAVYRANGVELKSVTVNDVMTKIELPDNGIFIVKVCGNIMKVKI